MVDLKKIIFICLLACFGLSVSAQTDSFQFGIRGGLNFSTAFVDDKSESKSRPGFHVGATAEYAFSNTVLIQSGLFFSTKGSKLEDLNASYYVGGESDHTHKFNQLYIELPVYAAFRMQITSKMNIVLGCGPYIGYGVGGKTKMILNNSIWSDGTTERSWNTFGDGSEGESLHRFDMGYGFKVDVEYKKYVFGFGFTTGVINIAKTEGYHGFRYRNFNFNVGMGYMF